ncbi:MAG: sodium:solute symporter family protein [Deltaproteobacteria bacterium]|jgi:solute:Na+ symporter, SSS family|nr:sodium:solute symporter family protein [Deltaproteobacteria bacterium]MBT4266445.1 sodium:solute symporter family protein [Deltaproteobacteria bacterium]MBT4640380.1 sodium:solute symporter family protein [Deltaproteobacteria bacterium]MBT6503848.1 sodium:solute symporter family protein [Deltaproteobacteria bacterium]MBT6613036.1 sodium:solute symporter family protein [Deltaproteobacteria bacterium]
MTVTPNPTMLWFVIGYGVIMVILGIWFSRRISSSDDFILAGKSLGPFVLAGTLMATFTGSGTVTGGSNSIGYSYGFWPANLLAPGLIIAFTILFLIAPRIRRFGKYTVSQILETQYGQGAKVLSAIIIILAYTGIVSYQFKGLAFVLNVTTGIPVATGTIIAAVLIIFLAVIGGLMAVAPTDALSAFLMIIGLIIAIPSVLIAAGGWDQVVLNLPPENLTATGSLTGFQMIGFLIPILFLMLGDQNIYQRLASSDGEKSARSGLVIMGIGMFLVLPSIPFIAMIARSMFPDINPGMALISMTTVMPTILGGIMLAAIAAFVVTTGNSYLLSGATSLTYDVYVRYFKPNANSKEILFFTKVSIPILGVMAFVLLQFFPTILKIQMTSYLVYGAGITPAVLAVFIWPRVNKWGGIASMITGVVATLALYGKYGMAASAMAVPIAVFFLVVVTLITPKNKAAA